MKKAYVLYVLVLIIDLQDICAQWTPADSIWLQNILSGKDSLRLKPEIEQSIREGNLMNFGKKETAGSPVLSPRISDPKGFSDPLKSGNLLPDIKEDIKMLSPQFYGIHALEMPQSEHRINEGLFDFMDDVKKNGKKPSGRDFNDILSTAFDSHYRQLKKNKKNAVAYKTYNDLPSPELHEKQKQFLKDHPEARLPQINPLADVQEKDSLRTIRDSK